MQHFMQLMCLAGMRTCTCITCSGDGTGKLGEGMRAASWLPIGTPRGGRPPDAKGVSALGEGGEMRTTSRLQLCRRKPDDGLWARSVRSACAGTANLATSITCQQALEEQMRPVAAWPRSSKLTVTKLRVCNGRDDVCKMQQQHHFGVQVAPATTSMIRTQCQQLLQAEVCMHKCNNGTCRVLFVGRAARACSSGVEQ